MINWNTSKEDSKTIALISKRAIRLVPHWSHQFSRLMMDVTACHANGCPLALEKLLSADDVNFAHDIGGISRHIDRNTGQLKDCFVPRYALENHKPQTA